MAQKYKFGNGVWANKTGSTLAYNDENKNYKPLPFTFTRASIATRVNKAGLIEVVGNDQPRIDYTDSSDGVLLLEPVGTNLVTYSESMNQYTPVNGTITANALTSPEGLLNAVKFAENSANNLHYFDSNSISVTSGTKYTISVFAKYNGRFLTFQGSGPLNSAFATFNLQNGTVEQESVGDATIEAMPNDWYRCMFTVQMNNTTNAVMSILLNDSATGGRSRSYQGDGASGVYLFGFQTEQQSYATSYIPTSGSAVTRATEICKDSGNSEVFNDSEGVLFGNVDYLTLSGNDYFGLNDGTNNQRLLIQRQTTNIKAYINTSVELVAPISSSINKISVSYKSNNYKLYLNGFKVATNTSSSVTPSGLNAFEFELGGGFNLFAYLKAKEIGYYDTALTDAELETLTSYRSWESMVNEINLNIIYNG